MNRASHPPVEEKVAQGCSRSYLCSLFYYGFESSRGRGFCLFEEGGRGDLRFVPCCVCACVCVYVSVCMCVPNVRGDEELCSVPHSRALVCCLYFVG